MDRRYGTTKDHHKMSHSKILRCILTCLKNKKYPDILFWRDYKNREFTVVFVHKNHPEWKPSFLDLFKELDSLSKKKMEKYVKSKAYESDCKVRCKSNLKKLCKDGVLSECGNEKLKQIKSITLRSYRVNEKALAIKDKIASESEITCGLNQVEIAVKDKIAAGNNITDGLIQAETGPIYLKQPKMQEDGVNHLRFAACQGCSKNSKVPVPHMQDVYLENLPNAVNSNECLSDVQNFDVEEERKSGSLAVDQQNDLNKAIVNKFTFYVDNYEAEENLYLNSPITVKAENLYDADSEFKGQDNINEGSLYTAETFFCNGIQNEESYDLNKWQELGVLPWIFQLEDDDGNESQMNADPYLCCSSLHCMHS